MTAFRRDHPQALFLTLALLVNVAVARVPRHPGTEFAACFDMTVTVTALYYWLMVRPGLRPKTGMIFVALLGLLRASVAFPDVLPGKAWIGGGLELSLLAAIALVLRRTNDADPVERIRRMLAGILPFSTGERALTGELSVLYYAFAGRARPHVPPGAKPFTLHKREGFNDLFLMIALASLFEVVPMHLLLAHWSRTAAWVVTGLTVYGAVWAVALARSFSLRPCFIGNDEVLVRFGLLFSMRIPFAEIRAIGSEAVPGAIVVPRRAAPALYIEFRRPLEARKMLGFTKQIPAIGLAPDDPRLMALLEPYIDNLPR